MEVLLYFGLPTKNEHDDFSRPQKFIAYPQPHEILKCPKKVYCFSLLKIRKGGNEKMKNIEEKILMADEEIKQLQNKRKKLISQQKQEERKKRDKRIYEKGAVFESIFTESKNLTKDEFYQLITSLIRKEEANIKIQKIIESREQTEVENLENQEEETEIEE